MLHIGVCDDEQAYINKVLHDLDTCFHDNSRRKIHTFHSGKELVSWYEEGNHLDLLFLDMCMEEKDDGLTTARKLRRMDRDVAIVFLTSYNEFSRQGYEVRAFRYLLKGENPHAIRDCLQAYFTENQTIEIRKKDKTICLKANKIIYGEAQNKKVKLVTATGTYEYYHAFSQLVEELEKAGFVKTHRSYIVNLSYVNYYDRQSNQAIMYPDNFPVPVSRSLEKNFGQRYLDYKA